MITIIVKKGFLESYHESYTYCNDEGLNKFIEFCDKYKNVLYKVRIEYYSNIFGMPDYVFVKTTGCLYNKEY